MNFFVKKKKKVGSIHWLSIDSNVLSLKHNANKKKTLTPEQFNHSSFCYVVAEFESLLFNRV